MNIKKIISFLMTGKLKCLLVMLLLPCLLFSQDRPKVGVVLSGGGAKGAAHIGVLSYIEELGIPVDYVVGTSMGAIMGGMYSLGYSAVELENIISDLDWDLYMKDEIGVGQMSTEGRVDHNTFLLDIPFDIGDGKLQSAVFGDGLDLQSQKSFFLTDLPSGFVGGYNLVNLFNSLSVGYGDSLDFRQLPIPFACVATDVVNGNEVVLNSGFFTSAIRASMAIPGVFSPVVIDGRLLMDGGMSNNFPVDLCKQMGADIIIGVDVGSQLASEIEELQSLPQLMMQLINLMVSERTTENRRLCTVYIRPNVSGYNMLSFSKQAIATLVKRGYDEAKRHETQLKLVKTLTNPNDTNVRIFDARRARRISTDTIYLSAVEIDGVKSPDEVSWLLRKGNIRTYSPITGVDIENAVELFVGTGNYSRVNYSLMPFHPFDSVRNANPSPSANLYDLHLSFESAPPHSCAMGFRYDSEESAMIILRLGLNQNRFSGWNFGTELRLGYNPRFNTSLSWRKQSLAKFNVEYDYRQCKYDMGALGDGLPGKYESARTHRHNFSFYVSQYHMRNLSLAGGLEYEKYDFSFPSDRYTIFYDVSSILSQFNCAGLFFDLKYDTRDEFYMPRKGVLLTMDAHWRKDLTKERYLEDGRNKNGFADVNMMASYHFSPDIVLPLTFIPQYYNRFVVGNFMPSVYQNVVGGLLPGRFMDHQIPFVGITTPQMVKNCLSVFRMDVQWNISGNHYLTFMGNYMCSAANYDDFFSGSDSCVSRFGLGLQYAYKTVFGPISVDMHWSDIQRRLGMYFAFGYTF